MRQAALSAFVGATVAAVALLIGGRGNHNRPSIDGDDLRPGTKVTIQRNTGRLIDGTPTKQIKWHRLTVYRVAGDQTAPPQGGNIWTMKVGDNPDVLLVESQPE
jgi:hypothetical protein